MSLMTDIEDMVEELGEAGVDDLTERFPKVSREKIMQAMQNLRRDGRLVVVEECKTLGYGKGRTQGTYAIAPRVKTVPTFAYQWPGARPPSSVFELGTIALEAT